MCGGDEVFAEEGCCEDAEVAFVEAYGVAAPPEVCSEFHQAHRRVFVFVGRFEQEDSAVHLRPSPSSILRIMSLAPFPYTFEIIPKTFVNISR